MKMRIESTHQASTMHSESALTRLKEKRSRSARRNKALPHNNGMHPTAKGAAVIENLRVAKYVRGG